MAKKCVEAVFTQKIGEPLYGVQANYSIKTDLIISVTRDGDFSNPEQVERMTGLKHSMMASLRQAELLAFHMDVTALITHLTIILNPEILFKKMLFL